MAHEQARGEGEGESQQGEHRPGDDGRPGHDDVTSPDGGFDQRGRGPALLSGDQGFDLGLGEDRCVVGFVWGFARIGPGFVSCLGFGSFAGLGDLREKGDRVGSDRLQGL